MRTDQQIAIIITRATKDLYLELAKKWGFPSSVIAGSAFGLAIAMMHESGYSEERLVEIVRQVVGDLAVQPGARGAS